MENSFIVWVKTWEVSNNLIETNVCFLIDFLLDKLSPNAMSECFLKTDQDFMKRIAKAAGYVAKEKKPQTWLSFTGHEDTSSKPNNEPAPPSTS